MGLLGLLRVQSWVRLQPLHPLIQKDPTLQSQSPKNDTSHPISHTGPQAPSGIALQCARLIWTVTFLEDNVYSRTSIDYIPHFYSYQRISMKTLPGMSDSMTLYCARCLTVIMSVRCPAIINIHKNK